MMNCEHVEQINRAVTPSAQGCEDCLQTGGRWVNLRMCLICGHVGCCDASPGKHATAHFHASGHPIIQSFEPGEDWRREGRPSSLAAAYLSLARQPSCQPVRYQSPDSTFVCSGSGLKEGGETHTFHGMSGRTCTNEPLLNTVLVPVHR